jgi:hypothetical protein
MPEDQRCCSHCYCQVRPNVCALMCWCATGWERRDLDANAARCNRSRRSVGRVYRYNVLTKSHCVDRLVARKARLRAVWFTNDRTNEIILAVNLSNALRSRSANVTSFARTSIHCRRRSLFAKHQPTSFRRRKTLMQVRGSSNILTSTQIYLRFAAAGSQSVSFHDLKEASKLKSLWCQMGNTIYIEENPSETILVILSWDMMWRKLFVSACESRVLQWPPIL